MSRTPDEARRDELLERAVDYVCRKGLSELSLRPLAKAVEALKMLTPSLRLTAPTTLKFPGPKTAVPELVVRVEAKL